MVFLNAAGDHAPDGDVIEKPGGISWNEPAVVNNSRHSPPVPNSSSKEMPLFRSKTTM